MTEKRQKRTDWAALIPADGAPLRAALTIVGIWGADRGYRSRWRFRRIFVCISCTNEAHF